MYDNTLPDASKISKEDEKNLVYGKLAELPHEIADKITHAKNGGGRSLNAIWRSSLQPLYRLVLSYIGSQMSFDKEFVNQYRYISLSKMQEGTGLSKDSIIRILNGDPRKKENGIGLIDLGYIKKIVPTKEEQQKRQANFYCLTSKIFDEYMTKLADSYASDSESKFTTSRRGHLPLVAVGDTGLVAVGDTGLVAVGDTSSLPKVPSDKIPVCGSRVRETTPIQQPSTATHTQNLEQTEQKAQMQSVKPPASPKPPANQTHEEKTKPAFEQMTTSPPIFKKLCQDFARVLNNRLNRTFSDEHDCGDIIDRVMKESLITADQFKDVMQDMLSCNTKDVFHACLISKNNKDNLPLQTKEIAKNICTFIKNKDSLKIAAAELAAKKASDASRLELEKKKKDEEYEYLSTTAAAEERIRIAQEARQKLFPFLQNPEDSPRNVRNGSNLNLN